MMGESRVTSEVGFAHDVEQGMKNLQEPGKRSRNSPMAYSKKGKATARPSADRMLIDSRDRHTLEQNIPEAAKRCWPGCTTLELTVSRRARFI
jgi:hypothetical protein